MIAVYDAVTRLQNKRPLIHSGIVAEFTCLCAPQGAYSYAAGQGESMHRYLGMVAALMLAGCASNEFQVRERAAIDLKCDSEQVSVKLLERPYMGVTRYEADGCGDSRQYECRARAYSMGLPVGERACRREGGRPTGAAELPGRYGF